MLQEVVSRDPEMPLAYNLLALCLYYKDYAAADRLREAVELAPDDPAIRADLADALRRLADALLAREDYEAAANQLREAAKLAPDNPAIRADLANALRRAGRRDEALAVISNALNANPKNARAYNVWGHILREEGNYAIAESKYRKAVKFDIILQSKVT